MVGNANRLRQKGEILRRLLGGLAALVFLALPAAVSAQDKFFDSNGIRIRYVDQGSGEPIVLIHGYTQSIDRLWIDTGVLPNLARDHRVIAFDLRGHGKSDKPKDSKAYGQEMGQDAVRLLDHLKISRAHIVGYSLGAIITTTLLTTNPDRFVTATLGGHSGVRSWTSQNQQAADAWASELEGGTPFRSLILTVAPTDKPPPTEEAIRQRSRELVAVNDLIALAAYNRSRGQLAVTSAQRAAVRVPTLGVIGSADGFIVGMKELKTISPSPQVVVIDGATHGRTRGAPRTPQFVNAVREFIDVHKTTSSK